ncbi:class I SAM-dependent methyltransferase [Streptomyces venezuelae]|uniref:class I SAM-dependent methyltransferase n=1 Tax=Streptomyces venezuelae TaxID=54571 RepID=UPI00366099B8
MPPVPEQVRWGSRDGVGPGDTVLGPLAGKRVLDIGSGTGHYAVHLARTHGALVDAVELSPTQHQRATTHFGDVPGVRFLHADVIEHLQQAQPYQAAYGSCTLAGIDPRISLPALCDGLLPGAPLVFSALFPVKSSCSRSSAAPVRGSVSLRDHRPCPSKVPRTPRIGNSGDAGWRQCIGRHREKSSTELFN